jgi:glycosyltransferase involved in cell wall biosynthesis
MLSICIPRYNYNPSRLLRQLREQILVNKITAEIIVIDDASTDELPIPEDADQFIQLEENIGRSAIRNRFLLYAKYDYLLFLDNDVELNSDKFLQTYSNFLWLKPTVVYGGRVYPVFPPDPKRKLRWKYGRKYESPDDLTRIGKPYITFQTNNFVVQKTILQTFPFDESIREYGYEDLLFSLELKKNNIKIYHINNPVLNIHLETNEEFLKLTEKAMRNLTVLAKRYNIPAVSLIKVSRFLPSILPTTGLEKFFYRRLNSGTALIEEFQAWKLLVYKRISKELSHPHQLK